MPFFIFQKIVRLCDDTMVTLKVDADARAKIQGSDDLEKHPIVAKVKGTGKDGALSVQVSGENSNPISARISGDSRNPIAVGPIEVAPITIAPNLESVAKTIDLGALIGAFTKLSQGIKVEVANSGAPLSIALGKIPVDLSISVSSPASETVFKVEIKGTVGE
ncbi:MAG: hypothetical protein A4E49_01972 [Methanosaeta sp. PtaU1.Bin112]|nr:MAG: hypothetical protein A4E49_01972 [Methanosaeta sp. PtaU1.Bin112]